LFLIVYRSSGVWLEGRVFELGSGKFELPATNGVVEKSPSLPSVEYVPEVDCGTKTEDEPGRPELSVGGNVLWVGRDGGRFVFPFSLPGFLSKPSKSREKTFYDPSFYDLFAWWTDLRVAELDLD
jgi:hypothetical protein